MKRKEQGKGDGKKNGEGEKGNRKMGKGKGKRTRAKEKRKGEEKGKEKGKGRWKEDILKNVGRTHERTDTKVILYSVQCYALHWTDNKLPTYTYT